MSEPSAYTYEATTENFPRLVLENSEKGPVLVNYWSPRAGPCLMLMPRLVQLASEFGGRFLLAMLNTDDYPALARSHGVMSLPTIKVFRHGQAVDTLHGAESETVLRQFIEKHLTEDTALRLQQALAAHARGDTATAVRLAAEAAMADPENPRIPLELAKLLVLQERYAEADKLLQALPEATRHDPALQRFTVHVRFLRAAHEASPQTHLEQAVAEDPDNLEARFQLSAVHLVNNRFEAAMQQLYELFRRDRSFRHDAGRDGLLAVFDILGEEDERVVHYRSLLQDSRH